MSRIHRSGAVILLTSGLLVTLSACTPGVTQYWRMSSDGSLSTAWCRNWTIDSLTVTLIDDDYDTIQTFTIEGPELFVEEGHPVSLDRVAAGWTAPPPLDVDSDWVSLSITATAGDVVDVAGSVDRGEFAQDDWIASPSPGFATVSCELLD